MDRKYFRLTLPLPESVNAYLKHKVSYKGKKPVVVAYKTSETVAFEKMASNIVLNEMRKQNWTTPDSDTWVRVEAIWYFSKAGNDTNNRWKSLLDILQSVGVYTNDSKVIEASINTFVDSSNPRVELNIYTLQKKGIFLGEDHLKAFKNSNCDECSRPSSCRVLKTALDNKITEDISLADNICFKKKTKK